MPYQKGLFLLIKKEKKKEFVKLIAEIDEMQLLTSWVKIILSSAIYLLPETR